MSLLSLLLGSSASALDPLPRTTIMAMTGDIPLRGAGLFIKVEAPCLSDLGDVVFNGRLLSVGPVERNGIFRSSGDRDQIEARVLQGDRAPDNNGLLSPSGANRLQVNAGSKFSSGISLTDTLDGNFDNLGLFFDEGGSDPLVQVARGNQLVPNGNGQFLALFGSPASINDSDEMGFTASLRNTAGGSGDNTGIYRFSEGKLTELLRRGARNPRNDGYFTNLNPGSQGVAINATGRVVFVGQSRLDSPSELVGGIYGIDDKKVTQLVRDGVRPPDRIGYFKSLTGAAPALGDGGHVAFRGTLRDTALGTVNDTGVFRADGDELVEVARENEKVPGNLGRFADFGTAMGVNRSGTVLFHASISGATGISDTGVFTGDGTSIQTVVRANDRAPEGGRFVAFDQTIGAINDAGQVLFSASINLENGGSTQDTSGLFVFDPEYGMLEVARLGDLLGSAGFISSISVTSGLGLTGISSRGFNESGQVAYRCEAGVEKVVVLWSPPRAPVISSVSQSDGNLVITWSAFYEEAFLEWKEDLSEGAWKKVNKAPVLIDDMFQSTLPITEVREFYRLNDPSSDPAE